MYTNEPIFLLPKTYHCRKYIEIICHYYCADPLAKPLSLYKNYR